MSINLNQPIYIDLDGDKVKGRVCKLFATDFCCVYLGNDIGCLRFQTSTLEIADEPAPQCPSECVSGC